MSTTPRKDRSDNERRARAKALGLKKSATWSEVELATLERENYVKLAEQYGLDPVATWDDVYLAFRSKIQEGRAAFRGAKAGLVCCSPFLLLVLFWFNWLTVAVAFAIFMVVFILMWGVYDYENSEHVYHMLRYPEIKERARRDGLFGLEDDR